MAEGKNTFIMYKDLIHTVTKMAKTEAGKIQVAELFITILEYVNDKYPVPSDPVVEIVFEPIKQNLKRDLKKWEKSKNRKSEAGKAGGIKSGEARRSRTKQSEANEASASKSKHIEANEAVTVSVTDTVTVNGNNKSLIEIFFNDLPGSTHFENTARLLMIPKEQLLLFVEPFRKKAELTYPSFDRFCGHFKNWVAAELRNQKPPTDKVVLKNPFPKRP